MMTDYEQKSIKVLERIIIKNDPQDPNMDYENKSLDPENNLVISVFVSSFITHIGIESDESLSLILKSIAKNNEISFFNVIFITTSTSTYTCIC